MKTRRRNKKPVPKKSKRSNLEAALSGRSEPVLPDDHRIDCDLTTRTYRADPKTINEEQRSVECVIATEERVKVIDWSRWEVIEEILRMDGLKLPANGQVPLLDTHNRFSVQAQHGSTRDFRVDGNKLIGRDYFSRSPESEHAWTLCREGHCTDRSAGYRVLNSVMIEAGKSAEVAGNRYTASAAMGLRIALEWELRENSLCPIGADPKAKTRKQESPADGQKQFNRKERTMNEFKEWLKARGLKYDELSEAQRTALRADFDAEQQRKKNEETTAGDRQRSEPAAQPPAAEVPATEEPQRSGISSEDAQRIASEAVAAEQARQASIRTEAAGLGIDQADIQRMLDDPKVTIEQARAEFLKTIRERTGGNAVSPGVGVILPDRSVDRRMLVDVMLLRVGFEDLVTKEDDGEKRAELADCHRDMSMVDICRQAILLDGGTVPGNRDEMIRVALNTSTLPTVLGAVYHKSLLKGYNSVEPTWPKWTTPGNLSDFKTHTRVRLTGEGGLEKVGDGGDLKLGSETEEKATNKLDTYGKKDRYGRQAIINDDLDLLTKVPQRRGRDGQLLIGELVYGVVIDNGNMQDGVALFHANHSNLNTGKALTADNIAYAIIQFKKQKDKAGKRIRVKPVYLLVPDELEFSAKQHVESPLVVYAGTSAANKQVGNKNVLENVLTVIAETLLADTTFNSSASPTTWYLTGDPADVDTIEVGFLNGRRVPTVHMTPRISDMYVEFESYIDVGVGALDHRGLQKNTA